MTEQFDAVVAALGQHLGLPLTTTEGITSLTLDGTHTIHLAALGNSQLSLFMRLAPLKDAEQAITLLQQNLFSADPSLPRMALSPDLHLILWSHHPVSSMDGSSLYQALTRLHNHAQSWLNHQAEGDSQTEDESRLAPILLV
ncbi:MAG: CesT family type III secretion system chaperone [Aeromonas sp.]